MCALTFPVRHYFRLAIPRPLGFNLAMGYFTDALNRRLFKRRCLAILLLCLCGSLTWADYLEITLLGTGTPRLSAERYGSATLIQAGGKYFLFDAGRGAVIRLHQADITPDQIEQVFITHLHSDHITGLDDLWITGWIYQRPSALKVYGPEGTKHTIDALRSMYHKDIHYRTSNVRHEHAQLLSEEVTQGVIYQASGVTITAFYVDHKPVEPALGYRLDFGDRSVLISGDTTYSDNLIKHAQDVDVLIHEIAGSDATLVARNPRLAKIMAYHTNPQQLAKVLQKTQPRLAVFNHVLLFGMTEESALAQIRQDYPGRIEMGYDLMHIQLGEKITINTLP